MLRSGQVVSPYKWNSSGVRDVASLCTCKLTSLNTKSSWCQICRHRRHHWRQNWHHDDTSFSLNGVMRDFTSLYTCKRIYPTVNCSLKKDALAKHYAVSMSQGCGYEGGDDKYWPWFPVPDILTCLRACLIVAQTWKAIIAARTPMKLRSSFTETEGGRFHWIMSVAIMPTNIVVTDDSRDSHNNDMKTTTKRKCYNHISANWERGHFSTTLGFDRFPFVDTMS